MILWEIATCKIPYQDVDPNVVKACVKDGEREEIPDQCPEGYTKLIEQCWDQDPSKRPPIKQILAELDKVKQMLQVGFS